MSANSLSRKDNVSSTVTPQKGRFSTNILGDNMSSECFTPKSQILHHERERPKSRQPQRVATMEGNPHFSLKKTRENSGNAM
jgi:DNA-binding GntR family transcriptional regulator